MFCDEPIIRVYLGQDEYDSIDGADAFLDCYHDLAYHVTEGYRIVWKPRIGQSHLMYMVFLKNLKQICVSDQVNGFVME